MGCLGLWATPRNAPGTSIPMTSWLSHGGNSHVVSGVGSSLAQATRIDILFCPLSPPLGGAFIPAAPGMGSIAVLT